ncbi:hypothetical protein T02_6194 [Trichinella nativa]|uniref:Uncharacterized protein n=1 Tax=Trichinella nativa TaxID=6335 RepID=A0A0V1LDH3_9BILA|nr:hypothetical protein T02_6194 [Trichinella nativa]
MLWKKMQCYFGMDSACSHCPGAFAECTVACENTLINIYIRIRESEKEKEEGQSTLMGENSAFPLILFCCLSSLALVSPSASASPRLQLTVNLCHSFFITIFCPWQFSRADFQESIKHAEQVVVTTIWLSFVHICRSITTPKSIMQMRSRFSAYFNTKFSGFTSLCK